MVNPGHRYDSSEPNVANAQQLPAIALILDRAHLALGAKVVRRRYDSAPAQGAERWSGSKAQRVAAPIRDRVRQPFALPLFRPPFPAGIAHRQGLAAQYAALPEAKKTRSSAQQERCCHSLRAPAPPFPESLAEGLPGRVHPILFVIALFNHVPLSALVASVVSQSASFHPHVRSRIYLVNVHVTVKHLGLFGLFPDATEPTSLCAINMGCAQHRWHRRID